ncbi:MAG: DNA-3-methyladenine glycosylase [Candidatus Acidiferrales bacterium]
MHAIVGFEAMIQAERPDFTRRLRRLRRAELPIDTIELARYLVGKTLVHDLRRGRLAGRIVETEAYPIGDPAGHAFTGHSRANHSLFLRRGHAYVRFTYGSCWLMNVSSEIPGTGAGVLIRALEPFEGVASMEKNRGTEVLRDLARGPGRLASALGIDKRFEGVDLCSPKNALWLGAAVQPVGAIGVSTRIGITRAAYRKLRFYEKGSAFVSGPARLRA